MPLSDDLEAALGAPTAREVTRNLPRTWTPKLEIGDDGGELVTEPMPGGELTGEAQLLLLKEQGLDPGAWRVTRYRRSRWQRHDGEWLTSHRLGLEPTGGSQGRPDVDELVRSVRKRKAPQKLPEGEWGYVHATGDMQLGKADGDGVQGTLDRILESVELSVRQLKAARRRRDIGHIHVAFLGDHLEGFVSQGGSNAWRTTLTVTEQLRLVRRIMMHHVETFAPLAAKVTFVAVPGNHGETVRFGGKGITRYDDSFDTEPLIAVSDACHRIDALGHVEFYTPQRDRLTVLSEVAGTSIGHAHGHQWRPGRYWDWLDAQSGNRHPLGSCDLLLAGHHHHSKLEERGPRTFIQVPAQESESSWWLNQTGQVGNPGAVSFVTKDGRVEDINILRGFNAPVHASGE